MQNEIPKTSEPAQPAKFFLIAGNLCVDFINTKIWENGAEKDLLVGFADLAAWAAAANLLKKSEAEKLIAEWSGREETKEVFAEARAFREVLHKMIADLAHGKSIGNKTIEAINGEIKNQSGAIEVRATESGFEKMFRADFREPRQLLAPIAESAADLLCYGNPAYLKKCESDECVLYFYDMTKNHTRRWCSMAGCGNRAKAAAFYRRRKETKNR